MLLTNTAGVRNKYASEKKEQKDEDRVKYWKKLVD